MSFEGDAPMRTICPSCEKYVDTEGYGIPAYVLDENRTVYHAKCAPEFCTHERRTVRDWKGTGQDERRVYFKCRDCGEFFDELQGPRVEWMREANDLLLKKGVSRFMGTASAVAAYSQGKTPEEFVNEVIGSLVRAGEMEDE